MRIIRGKYKGRTLSPPSNLPVRPTTDFAKTGLFNLVENRYDLTECSCLDLFSGTGSISLEFISRGCRSMTSVDRDKGCIKFLEECASKLGIDNLTVFKTDIFVFLKKIKQTFDIIFMDPPFDVTYRKELVEIIFNKDILKDNGMLILEHPDHEKYDQLSGFRFTRSYGNVAFSFFSKFESETNHPS